jgi:predicted HD phosphohydrolase
MNDSTPSRARFTSIADSTSEDWATIKGHYQVLTRELPDRVLAHLRLLEGDYGGFPIDRLQHCLQTATLAQEGGESEEYVVCALLHDIGDLLGPYNHADVAAVILKPYVTPEHHWMVEKHGIFQGYYFFHHLGMDRNLRDAFRDHPGYDMTARFCARYDGPAFDAKTPTLPLSHFEPLVRRVLSAPRETLYTGIRDA